MSQPTKRRRSPRAIAILVFIVSFVLSFGIVAGLGYVLVLGAKLVHPTLASVLLWGGTIPLVIGVLWLSVFLVNVFEKTTRISLRTESGRE